MLVMPPVSKGGETSTRSAADEIETPEIADQTLGFKPPGSGVPVPGAFHWNVGLLEQRRQPVGLDIFVRYC